MVGVAIDDWDFDEDLGGTFAQDRARYGLPPLEPGPDEADLVEPAEPAE